MMEADEPLVGGQTRYKRKRLVYFGIVAAIIVTAIVLGVGLGLGLKHKNHSEPVPQENLFTYGFNDIFNSSFKPSYYSYAWSEIGGIYFVSQGRNVYQHNVTNNQRTLLLNSSSLPENLQSYSSYSVSPNGRYMALAYNTQKVWRHSFVANYYIYDTNTNTILGALGGENASIQNLVWNPSESSVAYVYNNDIYLTTLTVGLTEVIQVTNDGLINSILNGILSWVYEEEIFGDFNAIWFSSNGNKLSFLRSDESNVPEFEFAYYDMSPYTDIIKLPYPKPGYPNPIVSLGVYDINNKITAFVNSSFIGSNDYIYSVQWNNDILYVQYLNRNQTTLNIVTYEGQMNSQENELFSYSTTDRWIDVFPLVFLNNGNAVTLKAAENEFNHIFNLNTQTFLTEGDWLVVSINGYNSQSDTLFFTSTEISSITRHVYSIKSEGTNRKRVTGDTNDDAYYSVNFDISGEYYVLSYLGPLIPNQYLYSSLNTEFKIELTTNQNLQNLLANYKLPSIEYGTLPIVGTPNMMIRYPPDFDSSKKYPVLMFVYGGPDSQQVTKRFDLSFNSYVASQLGYVVVVVDGRGTGGRGYNYEKYVYLKLGQYETIDQVAAAQYLQENYDWVDDSNVGIWGWSYGGFMTLMSLANGSDTFNFGISVAPVTSWTFYDSTYTERYMLTPELNPSGYQIGSALYNGPKIKNNALLLIHGTADDNVHFENTAEMAEVLIQNKIQFETQFYTNSDHSISNGNSLIHLYTRMSTFLTQKINK